MKNSRCGRSAGLLLSSCSVALGLAVVADADRGRGAERRPVEMVAGIRQEHRRHRRVRHRRRMRQGRAARLQGPPDLLVHRPDRRRRPRSTSRCDEEFWAAWKATYPNIETDAQNINYNDLLDKLRTASLGNAAPDGGAAADPGRRRVRRQGLSAGAEARGRRLLDRGLLARRDEVGDLGRQDLRHPDQQRDDGASSGTPRSSSDAGLDPEKPPATWDDVVAYSKQIQDKLGIAGYGLVAKQNAGNTPFRFMPQLWAYGGGALDEADASSDLRARSDSTATAPRRRCRRPTTCMCATSRCRSRR